MFSGSKTYNKYRFADMHLPTYATSPQAPTSLSHYLTTTIDAPATPTEQDHPNPLSIFTPPTTDGTANVQTSRRIVWQTPNVVMDNIPTTLVTVTTTARATRWITLPAKPTSSATDGLLTSTTATQHAAVTSAAELADVGEVIPDWPPLLIVFLLCWVTVAWVVAVVLYFATFPEKVAWLDGVVGRLRVGSSHKNRRKHPTGQGYHGEDYHGEDYHGEDYHAEDRRDTAAVATGLGISFIKSPLTPRLRRPRSFDADSLEVREPRSLCGGIAATAPLPSNGRFEMLSPDASLTRNDTDREHHREDLESGGHAGDEHDERLQGQPEAGGIAGVLESVNALIDFVARHLAKMASDRVTDSAERGLLLPVREEEREPAGVWFESVA